MSGIERDLPSTPTTATAATLEDKERDADNEKDYVRASTEDAAEPALAALAPGPQPYGPAPDGGAAAWRAVLGAFFASFVQFGIANSYAVFQAYYETGPLKHYNSDTISWIGATQQFILFFASMFAGRAFDAYGAHAILLPGSVCLCLSLFMISLCKEYYQFMLAQGILFGIGSSMIFTTVISTPQQWFDKRRALAGSVAICGSGFGGVVWPIALQRLFKQIGFGWTLRAVGFIAIALLAVSNALVRTRLPRRKPTPLRGFHKPLISELPFFLFTCSTSLCCWGMFTPFFYISVYASHLGASATLAFYCVSFMNAGSTVGRLFAFIGDRFGRYNVLIINSYLTGILLLGFWAGLPAPSAEVAQQAAAEAAAGLVGGGSIGKINSSVGALIAFGVLFGFTVGMIISMIPPCIAHISKPHEIGTRIGVMYTVMSAFTLSGPPINGVLMVKYPGTPGFRAVGLFSGFSIFVGAMFATAARFSINRKLRAIL
ncbi:hypothetical protein Q8F55_003217 [Vanrija albida]|uniref:Major facilitator superfamily (MFS) profile domain-containing protein n=1 Tax=Vanrija albida TaxID=181172 RepID=A0ABR3QBW4_9TREE